MPIYEYQREDGSIIEVSQSINEKPLEVCPETGQKVKKIISKNAFHLKGGGWYKTDYTGTGGGTKNSNPSTESTEKSTSEATGSAPASESSSTDKKDASTKKTGGCGSGCGCH